MSPTRRTPQRGARPGNSRPASRVGSARVRGPVAATARPKFTNRAVILVVVFAVLVVSYASSLRTYLQQRSHIGDLKVQIAQAQKDIGAAEREKRRWKDPAYVQAQARQRFGWVLPGETSYQVIGADGKPLSDEDELTDPSSIAQPARPAWWTKAYGTLEAADHPVKKVTPKPAGSITPPPVPKQQ